MKRVLIKLSGESLASNGKGIDFNRVIDICNEIKEIYDMNIQIGIVVGGGNLWRGRSNSYIDKCTSDYVGMLGTTMNALVLKDAFRQIGVKAVIQSGLDMEIIDKFNKEDSIEKLEEKSIVIFSGGTGSPYFSTDTAAALRALEIEANVILKLTNVDGIYTSDPNLDENAKRIDRISFDEVIDKNLKVMDLTAITLCKDNNLPIIIFNFNQKGNLKKVISGEKIGSFIG